MRSAVDTQTDSVTASVTIPSALAKRRRTYGDVYLQESSYSAVLVLCVCLQETSVDKVMPCNGFTLV